MLSRRNLPRGQRIYWIESRATERWSRALIGDIDSHAMHKSAKFKRTFQASVAESLIADAWRPKVDVATLPAVPQNDGMGMCAVPSRKHK